MSKWKIFAPETLDLDRTRIEKHVSRKVAHDEHLKKESQTFVNTEENAKIDMLKMSHTMITDHLTQRNRHWVRPFKGNTLKDLGHTQLDVSIISVKFHNELEMMNWINLLTQLSGVPEAVVIDSGFKANIRITNENRKAVLKSLNELDTFDDAMRKTIVGWYYTHSHSALARAFKHEVFGHRHNKKHVSPKPEVVAMEHVQSPQIVQETAVKDVPNAIVLNQAQEIPVNYVEPTYVEQLQQPVIPEVPVEVTPVFTAPIIEAPAPIETPVQENSALAECQIVEEQPTTLEIPSMQALAQEEAKLISVEDAVQVPCVEPSGTSKEIQQEALIPEQTFIKPSMETSAVVEPALVVENAPQMDAAVTETSAPVQQTSVSPKASPKFFAHRPPACELSQPPQLDLEEHASLRCG